MVFQDRRNTGRIDLEATEMAMRAALHRAGAAALSQLLEFPAPTQEGRTRACPCGQQAHYRERRSKPVLTAVGLVEVLAPIAAKELQTCVERAKHATLAAIDHCAQVHPASRASSMRP